MSSSHFPTAIDRKAVVSILRDCLDEAEHLTPGEDTQVTFQHTEPITDIDWAWIIQLIFALMSEINTDASAHNANYGKKKNGFYFCIEHKELDDHLDDARNILDGELEDD